VSTSHKQATATAGNDSTKLKQIRKRQRVKADMTQLLFEKRSDRLRNDFEGNRPLGSTQANS
jgi:hypothetical protein